MTMRRSYIRTAATRHALRAPPAMRLRRPLLRPANNVLATPDIKALFNKSDGSEPYITTLAQFNEVIRRDTEKYLKIIDSLKLTAEQ